MLSNIVIYLLYFRLLYFTPVVLPLYLSAARL